MSLLSNRSAMVLFHDDIGHRSQKVRIVIAEKGITCNLEVLSNDDLPKEILEINPNGHLPLLVDRELSLYHSGLIVEYLDERFPHPPLLPVYPVARANCRELMLRIDREWCPLVDSIISGKLTKANEKKTKEELIQELATISPIFKEFPFFMNEDFTLVDCYLAPIMWRLTSMGINLPYNKQLKPLLDYQNKIFERPGFIDSLTTIEKDLRAD